MGNCCAIRFTDKKVTTLRNLERVRLLRVPRGLLGRAARPPALDLREEVLPFHLSPDVEVGHRHHPDEHADDHEPRQRPRLEARGDFNEHMTGHIPVVGLVNLCGNQNFMACSC